MTAQESCPLCGASSRNCVHKTSAPFAREFFACSECSLIFVPSHFFLSRQDEEARYLQHNNQPDDPKYRAFLSQVVDPLIKRLRPGQSGLDYGSGPGPTLEKMFQEAGFAMVGFDPVFSPVWERLQQQYDFITCTETAEHFHRPDQEFSKLNRLLRPGGLLTLLTQTWSKQTPLLTWYYLRDPTHVVFYHHKTFEWLGRKFGWRPLWESGNVVTFQKG